jgi:hypothetical protein
MIEKIPVPPEPLPLNRWEEDMAYQVARKLNEVIEAVNKIQQFINRENPRQPPFPPVDRGMPSALENLAGRLLHNISVPEAEPPEHEEPPPRPIRQVYYDIMEGMVKPLDKLSGPDDLVEKIARRANWALEQMALEAQEKPTIPGGSAYQLDVLRSLCQDFIAAAPREYAQPTAGIPRYQAGCLCPNPYLTDPDCPVHGQIQKVDPGWYDSAAQPGKGV